MMCSVVDICRRWFRVEDGGGRQANKPRFNELMSEDVGIFCVSARTSPVNVLVPTCHLKSLSLMRMGGRRRLSVSVATGFNMPRHCPNR